MDRCYPMQCDRVKSKYVLQQQFAESNRGVSRSDSNMLLVIEFRRCV